MAQIISVISGKGGTGKSTFSAGLALSFAKLSYSVLLVDLDIGLRSLDLLLGLEQRVVFDIGDVLDNKCKVDNAIVKHKTYSSLQLLCAPQTISKTFIIPDVITLIKSVSKQYDYIILDMPAGIGLSVVVSKACADLACVIVTPDSVTIRDAARVCNALEINADIEYKIIINRVSKTAMKTNKIHDLDEILDCVGAPLLGVIKEDNFISAHLGLGTTKKQSSNETGEVFQAIAKRITGRYVPLVIKSL